MKMQIRGILIILTVVAVWPVTARTDAIWPIYPDTLRDSLATTYGQYQRAGSPLRTYLHSGTDIFDRTGTRIVAADSGYYINNLPSGMQYDSLAWTMFVDYTRMGPFGWSYTHLNKLYTEDTLHIFLDPTNTNPHHFWQGDTVGCLIQWDPERPQRSHLHIMRYGVAVFAPSQPPGIPIVRYPAANPLGYLPEKSDTEAPIFVDRYYNRRPLLVQRDSAQSTLPAYSLVCPNGSSESLFVANQHVDVVAKVVDRVRRNGGALDTFPTKDGYCGVEEITYEILGENGVVQQPKGFGFLGPMLAEWGNEATCEQIAKRIYADNTARLGCRYIVSNVLSWDPYSGIKYTFTDPDDFDGYWNTKQHKNRAWNEPDAAINAETYFPDGYYSVRVTAKDHKNNSTSDSIKVIVNNFPPVVRSTSPDSGGADVPLNAVVRVVFDQPMDTLATKRAMKVRLAGSSDTIPGSKSWNGTEDTLTLTPQSPWLPDTVYRVTLVAAQGPDSTQDVADSLLTQDYSFPFTTRKRVLLFSEYRAGESWLLPRDTLGDSLRGRYDVHAGVAGAASGHPGLCYDKRGNNYVNHNLGDGGGYFLRASSFQGDSLWQVVQRPSRAIATDDTVLFVLVKTDSLGGTQLYDRYRRVIRMDLQGNKLDSIDLGSLQGRGLSYSVSEGLLYVSGFDSLSGRREARVRKYTPAGSLVADLVAFNPGDNASPNVMVNDRKALLRNVSLQVPNDTFCTVTFRNIHQWNETYSLRLWPYDPYGGIGVNVWGACADAGHFYVLCCTWTSSYVALEWVCVLDKEGRYQRTFTLPDPEGKTYGAIAVYPSVLGVPGFSGLLEGEGMGGGPQAGVTTSLLPKVYALGQSYPNPAKGGLRIDYALPKESQVFLRIYNVAGQLVRTLREGKEKPGFYKAEWDGKDQHVHRVSSGVYLYRMEAGEFRKTRKLVVVR